MVIADLVMDEDFAAKITEYLHVQRLLAGVGVRINNHEYFAAMSDYIVKLDAPEELWAIQRDISCKIRKLEAMGQFGCPLLQLFRSLQKLVEGRIQRALSLFRTSRFRQERVLIERNFFECNGLGRPPCMPSRALKAGLSLMTGRMCSSPAFA